MGKISIKILFLIVFLNLICLAEIYKISSDDVILLRRNNFSNHFIESLYDRGYIYCSIKDIIKLKKNNLSEALIYQYIQVPLKISVEDLIRLRKANFNNDFLSFVIKNGYSEKVSISKMIEMKKNKIDPNLILRIAYARKKG